MAFKVYWFRRCLLLAAIFGFLWMSTFLAHKLKWDLAPEATHFNNTHVDVLPESLEPVPLTVR